ncbi:MAG TPA: hypothetical protein VMV94_02055, partial [Phycisphaerae bacterium]|nr:hypothetical protein [Phycisphaerae bacterium]
MKPLLTITLIVMFVSTSAIVSPLYGGDVIATSVATNGGSSSSTATACGNASAAAHSAATNGGRAVANADASG